MKYPRLVLLLFVASAALGASTAPSSNAAGTAPIATTSTAYLTTAEARQATRREVFRIARRGHDEPPEDFEIKWCRRRSALRVGCRYTMWIPIETRAMSCHGGVRVTERAGNRHHARAWRDCVEEAD